MEEHIDSLCRDYLFYYNLMISGQIVQEEEYRDISAQRTLLHNELLELTGLTRANTNMPNWARERLRPRRHE